MTETEPCAATLEAMARELSRIAAAKVAIPVTSPEVERLDDNARVWHWIREYTRTAREILAIRADNARQRDSKGGKDLTLDALKRGVRMRTITCVRVLELPDQVARIMELNAAGDLHRVLDEPLRELVIFDRSIAFIAIDPAEPPLGALMIRQTSIVDSLTDLFQQTWHRAREIEPPPGPLDRLTRRECEVLSLMATGRTNGAIARTLHITEAAVAKHVASIFSKLQLAPGPDDHRRVLAVLTYLGVGPK
ncbi:LuxR C-terminal-related transcriptional regulator [Nonomuraea sp. NPDC049152]|uniref:helix-turn-helix transcriptional regulator n=1 Tax=Nonomuraea sp. NPDC049152 TaxID=3154350 RepID=UPI0033CE6ADE